MQQAPAHAAGYTNAMGSGKAENTIRLKKKGQCAPFSELLWEKTGCITVARLLQSHHQNKNNINQLKTTKTV
jgi:hypothetical protein